MLAPQTQKDADARKFEFKFGPNTTKAESQQKRDKSKSKAGGPAVAKKKPNLNKSQVINLNAEKVGHHRTQTFHGVPNYEVVNLKLPHDGQRSSGREIAISSIQSPSEP